LEAALNPEPGPWMYYVLADANGKHAFATTGQEFERLRAQAQAKGLL
jgi:cell division protein YceG involved in septum cleavage